MNIYVTPFLKSTPIPEFDIALYTYWMKASREEPRPYSIDNLCKKTVCSTLWRTEEKKVGMVLNNP